MLVEGGARHDHAGGAEAALERLRIEKGLLHRVQLVAVGQPLDGGDLVVRAAEGRHEAGVIWLAVEPDGAGAAIALVAALLHAEKTEVAQERPQALTGRRLGGKQTCR